MSDASTRRTTSTHSIDGAEVVCDVVGEGTPVVLVHGWACRRRDWDPIVEILADRYRLIAVDLPWHGDSTAPDANWSIARLGALVDRVAHAQDAPSAPIVGHSLGAAVALEASLAGTPRPVIGLDGLTFLHMYPRIEPEQAERTLRPYYENFTDAVAGLCQRSCPTPIDATLLHTIINEMTATDPHAGPEILRQLLAWDMDAALDRAAAANIPMTVFAAQSLLAEAVTARYGSRFSIVPVASGGHFFFREFPHETAERIDTAVRELSAAV